MALGDEVKVIDVREPDEWAEGHIPWAIHVPLGTVPDNLDKFDGTPTYVVCGSRAGAVVGPASSPQNKVSTRSTWSAACSLGRTRASPAIAAMPMADTASRRPERIDYEWVDQQAQLDAVLASLLTVDRYALDTEFHRERTYFPKLALIQVAWLDPSASDRQRVALVDPLTIDMKAFVPLFESDTLCVIHAAQQDLDVLTHATGAVPQRMFDTQIAAGFAGYGTPSLVSLLQGEVGVSPPKGDRLTDWLRRPLSDDQMQYAASDVEFLLEVHDRLVAKVTASGRTEWVADACEELRTKPVSGASPDDAWLRLKDARKRCVPAPVGSPESVAAWRERRAMRLDVPVRQVLPDLAILGISQRAPSTVKELSQARGVDDRHGQRFDRRGDPRRGQGGQGGADTGDTAVG